MNDRHSSHSGLDPAFVEAQRKRLQAMLEEIKHAGDAAGSDEVTAQFASVGEVRDSGDDGLTMEIGESDDATVRHAVRRLGDIRRALKKIEQGTYGLSDVSGKPIGKERLMAVPEALTAIGE